MLAGPRIPAGPWRSRHDGTPALEEPNVSAACGSGPWTACPAASHGTGLLGRASLRSPMLRLSAPHLYVGFVSCRRRIIRELDSIHIEANCRALSDNDSMVTTRPIIGVAYSRRFENLLAP